MIMEKVKVSDTGIPFQVIENIQRLARQYQVKKVILFGSRARGDFRKKSDIDLAVEGGNFARFCLDVEEETATLLQFDFVNLDRELSQDLLDEIQLEGRILYESEDLSV